MILNRWLAQLDKVLQMVWKRLRLPKPIKTKKENETSIWRFWQHFCFCSPCSTTLYKGKKIARETILLDCKGKLGWIGNEFSQDDGVCATTKRWNNTWWRLGVPSLERWRWVLESMNATTTFHRAMDYPLPNWMQRIWANTKRFRTKPRECQRMWRRRSWWRNRMSRDRRCRHVPRPLTTIEIRWGIVMRTQAIVFLANSTTRNTNRLVLRQRRSDEVCPRHWRVNVRIWNARQNMFRVWTQR